jgi:hypothetical protein
MHPYVSSFSSSSPPNSICAAVGYGNQSPQTSAGRWLVIGLGWFSTIAFGGITVYSSSTWTALFDDLFKRVKLGWLAKPRYAVLFWGASSLGWISWIAVNAQKWWTERIPGTYINDAIMQN